MIKTIRLHNFKAYRDTGVIQLKPITVIAGANSGGKSTILQSLLLLKQTLEAPTPEIDLSLDGRYVQYTGISDITYGKPPPFRSQIGFSFQLESRLPRNPFPPSQSQRGEDANVMSNVELTFRYKTVEGRKKIVLDHFSLICRDENKDLLLDGTFRKDNYRLSNQNLTMHKTHFLPYLVPTRLNAERRNYLQLRELSRTLNLPFRDLESELGVHLEYLGPLRERPKSLYLHSGNAITEIGESGQYAAQILWLERDNKIQYRPQVDSPDEEVTLSEAVNDALQRLGLSQSVKTESVRSMMYQILLGLNASDNRRSVTIADVGFGVSQLLPILVLCLRAHRSSIILLEQPEIHLHPKLQANLADFLLAVASQGIRIVVETHSDHFINRLRRRIAEDSTNRLRDQINILFVHPPQDNEGATIQPLELNEFGVIENWPPDFLPEAADEAEAIFVAGLAKRGG